MDASMGGRVSPSPPPLEKINWQKGRHMNKKAPYKDRGPSYSCGDLFANFLLPFSMSMGGPFWACPPPPPYKNFCGRHAVV